MPIPDVVIELSIPFPVCPPQDTLNGLREQALESFGLSSSARAIVRCSDRAGFFGKVVSLGFWKDAGNASDPQLSSDLAAITPLSRGRSLAMIFTLDGLRRAVDAAWALQKKKIKFSGRRDFVRLSERMTIDTSNGRIITRTSGEWKRRWVPNIGFSVVTTEALSVLPPGSKPPLTATFDVDINVNILVHALIVGLFSPLGMALVLWKGDDLIESAAGSNIPRRGVGGGLASQIPTQFLTPISRPFLLGKIVFDWLEVAVDGSGVTVSGDYRIEERNPGIGIEGRKLIGLQQPASSVTETYYLSARDFEGTVAVRWRVDGSRAGRGFALPVQFRGRPREDVVQTIKKRISVEVRVGLPENVRLTDEIEAVVQIYPKPGTRL